MEGRISATCRFRDPEPACYRSVSRWETLAVGLCRKPCLKRRCRHISTLHQSSFFANLNAWMGKEFKMVPTRPAGCSVFLVEDEVMIRMMVADMLEELGHSVAAEAGEIGEAVKLVQSTEFDLAILDVNVNGKVITPVAELISARNLPFIFATGYGSSGLPQEYRDRPALQKPFQLETLAQVISATMKTGAA